jgi:Domain of unknown function (DUF4333)
MPDRQYYAMRRTGGCTDDSTGVPVLGSEVMVAHASTMGCVGLVCCGAILSACGGRKTIDAANTANYIRGVVLEQTGFRAVDVQCPSGVAAKAGGRFECHFTGPEGPYTAYLRIVKVHGSQAAFRLKTQPSNWPAPKLG